MTSHAVSTRRRRLGLACLTILVGGAVLLSPPARRGYEALLLLGDVVGRPLPDALDVRPPAQRRGIAFEQDNQRYQGDLYRPEGSVRAGIVFVPGAADKGKDDPRVVNFATALARARFAVLVPDVVALRQLRLLPESARDIGGALSWLLAQPELAPKGCVGLVATSVAIGPALLALLDHRWSASVRFVVSIGGYHDLPRTLTYLTTGHYQANGVSLEVTPKEYGKWVYALSNAIRLGNPAEREALEALARRKLLNAEADVTAELTHIGPEGKSVYEYIVNTDPARSQGLLLRLSARLRADVEALDLASRDLRVIQARFLLVHGIDDEIIPYGESIGLARAIGPGRARLVLLQGFRHVDIAPRFADGWRLWRALSALLRERCRESPSWLLTYWNPIRATAPRYW